MNPSTLTNVDRIFSAWFYEDPKFWDFVQRHVDSPFVWSPTVVSSDVSDASADA